MLWIWSTYNEQTFHRLKASIVVKYLNYADSLDSPVLNQCVLMQNRRVTWQSLSNTLFLSQCNLISFHSPPQRRGKETEREKKTQSWEKQRQDKNNSSPLLKERRTFNYSDWRVEKKPQHSPLLSECSGKDIYCFDTSTKAFIFIPSFPDSQMNKDAAGYDCPQKRCFIFFFPKKKKMYYIFFGIINNAGQGNPECCQANPQAWLLRVEDTIVYSLTCSKTFPWARAQLSLWCFLMSKAAQSAR